MIRARTFRLTVLGTALIGAATAGCAPGTPATVGVGPLPMEMRTDPPPLGPLRPYQLPAVQEFTLANGLRVLVLEQPGLPLVAARTVTTAGALYEPAEKAGLAVLTGSLLAEGTRTLTGPELAGRMERLGAQFQTGASFSQAFMTVTALQPALPEALRLAAGALMEPSFPEGEFTRLRTAAVASYRQSQATVEGLAADAFARAVYEPTAPYARPPGGTSGSLEQLTRQDVVEWHRAMYSPANTVLLLVGAITAAEARTLAQEAFGGWTARAPALPSVANPARPVAGTRVILVDRPGSVQSAIRIGQIGPGHDHPDHLRWSGISQVLGGGFNSRINQNLRETRGWTYGAFANLSALRGSGTFFITSSVRAGATDSALVESVNEYRRIATESIPPQELSASLNNLVGSFPTSVQTVQGLSQRMQTVLLYDLPLNYWGDYRERLAALTSQELLELARVRLTPDALTVVVAGDLATIEGPIRERNLGTVEVWGPEGVRIR
jgi:zinc protease